MCHRPDGSSTTKLTVIEEAVAGVPCRTIKRPADKSVESVKKTMTAMKDKLQTQLEKINQRLPNSVRSVTANVVTWSGIALVLVAFLWSFYPNLKDLWNIWQESDEYSSGFMVPLLASYILWSKRQDIAQYSIRPCLWGVLLFAAATGCQAVWTVFYVRFRREIIYSSDCCRTRFAAVRMQLFRKLSPILLFLLLMLPWPNGYRRL